MSFFSWLQWKNKKTRNEGEVLKQLSAGRTNSHIGWKAELFKKKNTEVRINPIFQNIYLVLTNIEYRQFRYCQIHTGVFAPIFDQTYQLREFF